MLGFTIIHSLLGLVIVRKNETRKSFLNLEERNHKSRKETIREQAEIRVGEERGEGRGENGRDVIKLL